MQRSPPLYITWSDALHAGAILSIGGYHMVRAWSQHTIWVRRKYVEVVIMEEIALRHFVDSEHASVSNDRLTGQGYRSGAIAV